MIGPVSALDPILGQPVPFRRSGKRWLVGNAPARLALEVAENDNGEIVFIDVDPATGALVAVDIS